MTTFWDADGFIALADAVAYEGFIGQDWQLPEVVDLFQARVDEGRLAVMYVGQELAQGRFELVDAPSAAPAEFEWTQPLQVVSGQLSFVTYTALTMVALFDDERLADQGSELEAAWAVDPGAYSLTFRRLAVDAPLGEDEFPPWEVVLAPGAGNAPGPFPGSEELRA
ncbi:hypothetical protein [Kytococcus sedentarius]|uniref:hypothetical protein n=1 Tax=Kytococcus sedentarius TaxID=1276 RepID=UPI0035BC70A1